MMRRTMLLALVVLCLSLMFNLLLARPRLSSATAAPMAITCDDVWCCVFDWGASLISSNPILTNGNVVNLFQVVV